MQPLHPSQASPSPQNGEAQGDSEALDSRKDASVTRESPHSPMAAPPGVETRVSVPVDDAPEEADAATVAVHDASANDQLSTEGAEGTQEIETAVFTDSQSSSAALPLMPTPSEPPGTGTYSYAPSPYEGPSDLPFAPPPVLETTALAQPATTRRSPLPFIMLIAVSTGCAALAVLLGYVTRDFAARNQLSFALFTLDGLRFWLPGLALALLTGAAVLLVAGRRASPGLSPGTAWIFPFVTMCAGLLVVSVYHDRPWWFVAPIVTWIALLIGTIARLFLTEPSGEEHDIARIMLTIITYVVAFLALAMIYINKLRSIFSATTVVVLCVLLLVQITDGETASLPRRLVYAVAGGLIIGQVTWVINYWSAAGWTGGAFLLAVFYLIAGLSAAQLRDHIGFFDVMEFGGVALLALVIVSAAVLYQS